MHNYYSPLGKTPPRILVFSPPKINNITFSNNYQQKQKSISFNDGFTQIKSYDIVIKQHNKLSPLQYSIKQRQNYSYKENVSPLQQISPNKICMKPNHKPNLQQQRIEQPLKKIYHLRSADKKNISDHQFQNKKNNILTYQIPNFNFFQSVRSTITNQHESNCQKSFRKNYNQNYVSPCTKKHQINNQNNYFIVNKKTKDQKQKDNFQFKRSFLKSSDVTYDMGLPEYTQSDDRTHFQQFNLTSNRTNIDQKKLYGLKQSSRINKCNQKDFFVKNNHFKGDNQEFATQICKNTGIQKNTKFSKTNYFKSLNSNNILKKQKMAENKQSPYKNIQKKVFPNRQIKVPSFISQRINKEKQRKQNEYYRGLRQSPIKIIKTNENNHAQKNQAHQNIKMTLNKHVKSLSAFDNVSFMKNNQPRDKKSQLFTSFKQQSWQIQHSKPIISIKQKKVEQHNIKKKQNERHQIKESVISKANSQNSIQSFKQNQIFKNPFAKQKQITTLKKDNEKNHANSTKVNNLDKNEQNKACYLSKLSHQNNEYDLKDKLIQQAQLNQPTNQQLKLTSKPLDQVLLIQSITHTQSVQPENFQQQTQKKQSIIQDIKQVLINCDLFSQQDYQNVFQNHQKDILNENKIPHQRNKIKTVKFENRTSLKDLIDPSESSDAEQKQRRSSQQKRLAQMASISQQKRSKWILQQTDTIKQSLKQLSQFNTQKQFIDNQWKRISVKDFSSQNKNANKRYSSQYSNIDNIKEDIHFELNEGGDQILYSTLDRTEQQILGQREKELSLEDFQIRWLCQQPLFLTSYSFNQQKNHNYIIYWARHKITGFICAIKKYQKAIFLDRLKSTLSQHLQRFIFSLKIQTSLLNHPNIQKIYGVFDDQQNIYVISQFIQAKLSSIIQDCQKQQLVTSSEVQISLSRSMSSDKNKIKLFSQIVDGLQEVHLNNILHKSFQPINIGILFNCCKIAGFYNCEAIDDCDYIKNNKIIFNEYSCPQVLFSSRKMAMDIWCLGILAYQLFVGKKPFCQQKNSDKYRNQNQTKRKILECNIVSIPQEKKHLCQEILSFCLKRDPNERKSIFEIKIKWEQKVKDFGVSLEGNTRWEQETNHLLGE